MTQPKIEGIGLGKPVMPFGSDGADWYAVLIDALGHLQVDVVSAALGSGGATEATLLLIKGYVDALETLLSGGLPAALDTGALKVKEQSPLTGGATEATLLLIKGYVDTLETLLSGGLPAALDSGALKTKEQSPLTGFATTTNQATMITALQLIDDLRNALGSVDTDDLQVDVKTYPGSNALGNIPFGYYDRYLERKEATSVNGHTYVDGTVVPSGEVWIVTSFAAYHDDPTARILRQYIYDGSARLAVDLKESAAQWAPYSPPKSYVLKAGDYLSVRADSLATGYKVYLTANGYKMKVA